MIDSTGLGINFGSGLGIGFIVGWFGRKVAGLIKKLVAAIVAIQIGFLTVLEQNGIITVHWAELDDFFNSLLNNVGGVAGFFKGILNFLITVGTFAGGTAVGVLAGWKVAG